MTAILIPKSNIWTPPSKWQKKWVKDVFPWLANPIQMAVSSFPVGTLSGGPDNPTPNINSITINNTDSFIATGVVRADRDGDLNVDGSPRTNEWLNSGDKTSTIGDDYEALLTKTSGALGNPTGASVGSWVALTSNATWTWSTTSNFPVTWNGSLEIREVADTSNSDSTPFVQVTLEVLGGGGIFC